MQVLSIPADARPDWRAAARAIKDISVDVAKKWTSDLNSDEEFDSFELGESLKEPDKADTALAEVKAKLTSDLAYAKGLWAGKEYGLARRVRIGDHIAWVIWPENADFPEDHFYCAVDRLRWAFITDAAGFSEVETVR